ncbi:MAG TPA: Uma2 family endonuclease [Bryobacteraceae bacterium]|nr:Uma2 family endonuclease [Bryobacteraceae bacterium]
MATTTTHLTIDDFERLPQEQAENHELVDGELVAMSGNTPESNSIRDLLVTLLYPIVREGRLGVVIAEQEYDFNGNAHAPDVSFFGPTKKAQLNRRKRVQRFVPDLAIEVVSENDSFSWLMRKKERYLSGGTLEVWIVSPVDREVLVYSANGDRILRGDAELSTGLLPGFRISVQRLFEDAND